MRLYPKCHPYWQENDKIIDNPSVQAVAYTAEGYILPCCWCDTENPRRRSELEYFGLYEPELKVSNVSDIKTEILWSPEWNHFHKSLLEDPENAPEVCKIKCSKIDDGWL